MNTTDYLPKRADELGIMDEGRCVKAVGVEGVLTDITGDPYRVNLSIWAETQHEMRKISIAPQARVGLGVYYRSDQCERA